MNVSHQRAIRHPTYNVGDRPFIVIWEVTRACDLACVHCRASAMPNRNPFELSTSQARDLIDQIAAFGAPPPLFVMTGGDPLKRADLRELVAYASSRKLPVALSPSATPLVTRSAIEELHDAGMVALSLSVDGAGPEVHDSFRGIKGVFARTMDAWDAARECGLKIQINTTVTRLNLHELPRIARMVRERGAMLWSVFFLVPVGRGTGLEQLTAEECEDVMHFLYDVATVMPVKTTEGHHYKRVVFERTVLERHGLGPEAAAKLGPTYHALHDALDWPTGPHARRSPMDVNAGRGFVFISHTGSVHPSGFLPIAAGNVRDEPLGRIYAQSPLFRSLRNPGALGGRCGRCEFAAICGGSRSRAFAASGDPCAEDPLCPHEPGTFPFPEELAALLNDNVARPHVAARA